MVQSNALAADAAATVWPNVGQRIIAGAVAVSVFGVLNAQLLFGAHLVSDDGTAAIDRLITGVVFIDALFFALTGLALIILRKRRADADRPFRAPLILAMLFVLGETGIVVGAFLTQNQGLLLLTAIGWIVGAAVIYLLFFRNAGPARLLEFDAGD